MNSETSDKMDSKNDQMILAHDILIAGEEISNLQLLSQFLSQAGYKVPDLAGCEDDGDGWL
jgi:hypothetical protein